MDVQTGSAHFPAISGNSKTRWCGGVEDGIGPIRAEVFCITLFLECSGN